MNTMRRVYSQLMAIVVTVATCLTLVACGGGGLEKAIKRALIEGDTTQARYDSICSIIKSNPESYGEFLTKAGEINVDALSKFINEVGSNLRPPMSWNIKGYGVKELTLTV